MKPKFLGNFGIRNFRLIDSDMFPYFKGNLESFGFWCALKQVFPILGIRIAWKYRHHYLVIPDIFDDKDKI